jgi:predicted nucleic acid-binding protein
LNVYAETSAVLAWLWGEPQGVKVRKLLASATHVISSEITLVECDRVMVRGWALAGLESSAAEQRSRTLAKATARWVLLQLDSEVLARARQPFPIEPLRTLDSLHLASALVAARAVPDLALLSLDPRLRSCAQVLGMRVEPESLDG